jgi:hypothetical protein
MQKGRGHGPRAYCCIDSRSVRLIPGLISTGKLIQGTPQLMTLGTFRGIQLGGFSWSINTLAAISPERSGISGAFGRAVKDNTNPPPESMSRTGST